MRVMIVRFILTLELKRYRSKEEGRKGYKSICRNEDLAKPLMSNIYE